MALRTEKYIPSVIFWGDVRGNRHIFRPFLLQDSYSYLHEVEESLLIVDDVGDAQFSSRKHLHLVFTVIDTAREPGKVPTTCGDMRVTALKQYFQGQGLIL